MNHRQNPDKRKELIGFMVDFHMLLKSQYFIASKNSSMSVLIDTFRKRKLTFFEDDEGFYG